MSFPVSASATSLSPAHVLDVEIADGIAVVTFDDPDASVNALGARAARDFAALLDHVDRDGSVRAVVLMSGKPDGWIAGADIDQFLEVRTPGDAEKLSREGQAMMDRIERLRVPVVAAIHGACLGAGLELALACQWRVATEHAKTTFALPEVQLGLIPGAGGTQRLPRRIGLQAALDMILTGKTVRARRAHALGLVEDLVHPAILRDVAMRRARELAAGTRPDVPREKSGRSAATQMLLEDNPIGRAVVFRQAREQVMKRTRGHYPAPLAALDVVADGYQRGVDAALKEESRRFGELAVGDVSRELVFLFFATTALKKDAGPDAAAPPLPAQKLAVVGAGFMGSGIAALAARQGLPVRLKDADLARVGKGLASVRNILEEAVRKRRITRLEMASQLALVTGTADYSGFRRADLVIEAVFEDLALKRQVIGEIEAAAPHAVVATNTSTLPIRDVAAESAAPERVVGMHFFSPVQKMPLLEVVVGEETAPEATATAVAVGRRLGKTVIVVHDGPGFYVNRILAPYVNEAGHLLDQGVPIEAVDRALVEFGFPVGPITLVDEVGLDVAGKSGRVVADAFGGRMQPSRALQAVLESGRLGRKGRQGFYRYDEGGRKGEVDESVYALVGAAARRIDINAEEIVARTVLPMLNEAARCLEEGIIRSPRDGDVGAVFGIGFPPFRGGPFRHIDALGAAVVVRRLDALDERFPGRFAPAAILRDLARVGGRFYAREGKVV